MSTRLGNIPLTHAERVQRIIELIQQGKTNKEIADELRVTRSRIDCIVRTRHLRENEKPTEMRKETTMELSNEAVETIATLDLIAKTRAHLDRLKQAQPETAIAKHINECRIEDLTNRINELLGELSNKGYEVGYSDNTTIVLKQGQKWLERMDWTEYTA